MLYVIFWKETILKKIKEEITAKVVCQIVAPDLRGHGETKVKDPEDLSMKRQIEFVFFLFEISNFFYRDLYKIYSKVNQNFILDSQPSMILVGHR